jgi:hypothetical protein
MTHAQKATIKKVDLAGGKIIVYYDLEDSNASNEYQLNLFSSRDNFATPLSKVKGDIGSEVKPGVNRKVEWSIREEMAGYKGRISLELRGRIYVPLVKFLNFSIDQSYKRGKSYDLNFKSGGTNPIHVELYKGDERVAGELNLQNNGAYTLNVPSKAKPGKDYRLKITDSKNSEETIYSPYFKVKPKLPLLVKILPVLAIGGVVAVVGGGGGSKNKDATGSLPAPPAQN